MTIPTYTHDPNADLDYGWDWSDWLGSDVITASTWSVDPTGPTLHNPTFSDTATTVWISGGTSGAVHRVINHITTDNLREEDSSFRIQVREK
jgi:hypothetical protein